MLFGFDDYELDATRLELRRAGEPVRADRMVLRLLATLVQRAGRLVTKSELIAEVWDGRAVSENVISVAMARLRKTLGHKRTERKLVVTVQGSGYRFVAPVTPLGRTGSKAAATALATHGGSPPLVGREPILRRLRGALDAARGGRGGVCLLTGEPGIGKTAATEQLAREAEALGTTVLWAYCQEVGETPPLWPFTQLVRGLLGRPALQANVAPELLAELRCLLPELAGEPQQAPPSAKHRLFEAVLSVLEQVAPPAGCLLIVDDLHRADGASLELLRYWMERIGHAHVLLVGTLRTVRSVHSLAEIDLRYVMGHRNCTRLSLTRLEPEAVREYVSGLLPDRDGSLGHAVWEKSEGNPFFMVELARQLADAPCVDVRSLAVSEQALELLRPRIVQLDAEARGVLSTAAVIGRRFELRLLQRVTGHDLATLTGLLDAAVDSEALIAAAAASTAFAFGHELIRQILYRELTPQARRRLHLKVGETLVQLSQEGEVVPSATLAYHYHAALPDSDAMLTVQHCQRAAYDATQMFAYGDSIPYLRHALEALSLAEQTSPRTRLVLLIQQAVAARVAAVPGFELAVDEAARVARAMGSGSCLISVALLLHLQPGFPMPPHARALLEEGIALLPPDETVHRGAALARLATCGPIAFDAARSRAQLEQALALVQLGDTARGEHHSTFPGYDALLSAYNVQSAAHYRLGGPSEGDGALKTAAAIEQLCRSNPRVLRVAPTFLDLHAAIVAHQRGELDAASAAIARVRQRAEELGARELTWYAERYQVLARLQTADGSTLSAELRALHARARGESIIGSALMCVFDEVVLLGDALAPADARGVLAHSPDDPPSTWSIKAQTLAAAGLHEEARNMLASVSADALAALPRDRDYVGTLAALARAATAIDAREHMEALDALLAPLGESLALHVSFLCLGPVPLIRGELARALGRPDEAARHFELAARTAARLGLASHARTALDALTTLTRAAPVAEPGPARWT